MPSRSSSRRPRHERGASADAHPRLPSRTWLWPAVALAAVFVLKLALAITLAPHPLLQPVGDLDSGEYWRLSTRVLDGDVLLQGTPFYLSPLYIYWLAFARGVSGGDVLGVLVLQALVGTAAVWFAARTATRLARRHVRAAYVAGGVLALTGVVALQEAVVIQSALDPFFTTLLAYVFTRVLEHDASRAATTSLTRSSDDGPVTSSDHVDTRWLLLLGVSVALLATNRPNAWLLLPLVLVAVAWTSGRVRATRASALVAVGIALILAPLTLRTARATGEWQVLPGHGGLNVYIGNHADATGTYAQVEGVRPSMAGQRDDTRALASTALGRPVTDADASRWFVTRAIDWWRAEPVAALRLLAYKAWLTVHAWELPVNVSYAWFRSHVPLLGLLPVGAWLLLPLGIAALVAVPPRSSGAAWVWVRWLLPAYLVSVALFFVVDRYRAPALVLASIHVGVVATMRREDVQSAWAGIGLPRGVVAGVVAVALGVIAWIPLPFQLGLADADTRMALAAIDAGHDAEADEWLAQAARADATPGVVWLRAGLAWQARGDLARAEHALREAHRVDPQAGEVAFALAEVLLASGKGAEAAPLLQQAAVAGIRRDRVTLDLALAQWQAGDVAAARATLARGVPAEGLPLLRARALASVEARRFDLAEWLLRVYRSHDPRDVEVIEKLGLVTARRGDGAAAASLLEEAVALDARRASTRFNLAIVRLQQGRRGEAVSLLREAVRIDPAYAQAAGALRELGVEP